MMHQQHIQSLCRKKLLLLFFPILALLLAGNATGQIIDRVAAVVNDDVILVSDVEDAGRAYFEQIKQKTPADALQEALRNARQEVLEGLIGKALVAQKAKKDKVLVTDDDLRESFNTMVKRSGLTEQQFNDKLKESGITRAEYEKNLRYQILQEKLINSEVRSKIIITDDMVKDYYDKHADDYSKGKSGYSLLQIGFTWGKSQDSRKSAPNLFADREEARKQAEKIHKLAEDGNDFSELAKKYSTLPSAVDGGDIGVLQADDMAADMRDAIVGLKPGQISALIESSSGYQFFKLVANKDGVDPNSTYDAAKEKIRETLYQQQVKAEFTTWVKKLQEQAYIKKMYQ